jgi:hypothetical protein
MPQTAPPQRGEGAKTRPQGPAAGAANDAAAGDKRQQQPAEPMQYPSLPRCADLKAATALQALRLLQRLATAPHTLDAAVRCVVWWMGRRRCGRERVAA